jgi:hypothetical protein
VRQWRSRGWSPSRGRCRVFRSRRSPGDSPDRRRSVSC